MGDGRQKQRNRAAQGRSTRKNQVVSCEALVMRQVLAWRFAVVEPAASNTWEY